MAKGLGADEHLRVVVVSQGLHRVLIDLGTGLTVPQLVRLPIKAGGTLVPSVAVHRERSDGRVRTRSL